METTREATDNRILQCEFTTGQSLPAHSQPHIYRYSHTKLNFDMLLEYFYRIYYDSMFRYAIYLILCLYICLEIVTTSVMKILRLLYALVSSIYHKC